MARPKKEKKPKAIASTQSLSAFVKGICDVMRRSNCASALQYVDNRTPAQIIESINAQGRIVSDALARLSALVADDLAAQLSEESV